MRGERECTASLAKCTIPMCLDAFECVVCITVVVGWFKEKYNFSSRKKNTKQEIVILQYPFSIKMENHSLPRIFVLSVKQSGSKGAY